jgi:enamine deaminase RidA (YjgF/YER057c/UK114 family)
MNRKVYVPDGIFDSRDYGFAQVAVISTPYGDAVHVSGQVAWDADQRIVGGGDVGRQLSKSLENLAVVLASVGAKLDQVGSLRLYIKQSHIHEGEGPLATLLRPRSAANRRVPPGSGCQGSLEMSSLSKWNRP